MDRLEVRCQECGRWIRLDKLLTEFVTSASVGWRKIYYCPYPDCGVQVGSSHGPDLPWGIYSSYFEDTAMEALERGEDWVRLAQE